MAFPDPGSLPWRAVPSVWPKAQTAVLDAYGMAIAHVIDDKNTPLLVAAPSLVAALRSAVAIVREERESFVECQTVGGDLATIDRENLPFLERDDAAIARADAALAQAETRA